ncbi:hypothetical protein [Enhygromyxa salina]|uniref:Uncharacterized protein n=1 Tax=Enhygromyxa salina TaxID=215803 RepID=A0A2S9YKP4_9BACT|nr:hypothetical protein [Enhygromyxa salina]PRQ05695.1 hypothetical protein ENSA7_44280 [Enhygromyxa salina]
MPSLTRSPSHPSLLISTAALSLVLGCGDDGGGFQTTDPATDGVGDGDGDTNEVSTTNGTGDGDGDPAGDGDPETGDGDGDTTTGTGPKFDTLSTPDGGDDGCGDGGGGSATLTGTVFAPNGTIPVVGALVYTTNTPPEGIPDQVYCAECVELECGVDFTETDIEGNFSLKTDPGGGKYLVVQKGQFLRVTQLDIVAGNTNLPDATVELPGEWDPANGLYIPKIAVADGTFDRIEDALGKFGLGDTMIANFTESTVPGTESFELWDNGRNPSTDGFQSQGTMTQLVSDPANLARYHIIFVPCSGDGHLSALNQQGIDNVRGWVEAGGRWYVADWANEWMSGVFPEYQNFYGGNNGDLGSYDSLADVLDNGMLEWLEALPEPLKDINPLNDENHPTLFQLPQLLTVDNWSGIQYPLPEVLVDDGLGNMVNVGHTAWLEGPGGGGSIPVNDIHPLTVTGQYGCGKIQFTSYHTAEFFDYVGLSPQELVLIYTILEIGVCQDPLPPPQG